MKITFLGQSGLHIYIDKSEADREYQLLVDPFLTGNALAVHQPDELQADFILLTHAHSDHYGDTDAIAKRCDATVISNFEIANHVDAKGIKSHPMQPGGSWRFPFGRVHWTLAFHSSSFEDGSYGGLAMGLVLEVADKRLYHAGDTALFSDMRLIGDKGLDLAFVPIGDNFTMGIEDAAEAVKLLRPKRVVPIHYDTFPYIEVDPAKFADKVDCECEIMTPGQSITL